MFELPSCLSLDLFFDLDICRRHLFGVKCLEGLLPPFLVAL